MWISIDSSDKEVSEQQRDIEYFEETESTVSTPISYYPPPSKIQKVAKIGITRSSLERRPTAKPEKLKRERKIRSLRDHAEELNQRVTSESHTEEKDASASSTSTRNPRGTTNQCVPTTTKPEL